jgi:hypothetical protein
MSVVLYQKDKEDSIKFVLVEPEFFSVKNYADFSFSEEDAAKGIKIGDKTKGKEKEEKKATFKPVKNK